MGKGERLRPDGPIPKPSMPGCVPCLCRESTQGKSNQREGLLRVGQEEFLSTALSPHCINGSARVCANGTSTFLHPCPRSASVQCRVLEARLPLGAIISALKVKLSLEIEDVDLSDAGVAGERKV